MPLISRRVWIAALICLLLASPSRSQNKAQPGNNHPTYLLLRNIGLANEAIAVNNLDIKRDGATFRLRSGTVCFVSAVEGRVTGAVFSGDGVFTLNPPIPVENRMLRLLTKEEEFSESFSQLAFRFTDSTYQEIKAAGTPASSACDAGILKDTQTVMRRNRIAKYNLDGRILEDVLGAGPGSLFVAFIHGKHYNDKELFVDDPHGAPDLISSVAPEEVELLTYDDNKLGVWAAYHRPDEYKSGKATGTEENALLHIEHQELDTTVERNANLIGKATTTFVSRVDGLRVAPFDLFPSLRVSGVTSQSGEALSFIQEDKSEDANYFVVLPKALSAGEKFTLTTNYNGKDAVTNEGEGNYFPVARHDWYPNTANAALGSFATYDMTFRIPKGLTMAATGAQVSDTTVGSQDVSVWKSEMPQTVAGFNFGAFKLQEAQMTNPSYYVVALANSSPSDAMKQLQNRIAAAEAAGAINTNPIGNLSTAPMLKNALAEGQLALQLYTEFFGPIGFKRLAITQQAPCNFGQSWPELVWLPTCYFYDATVRHSLGLDSDRGYWKIVTPHEVAHQWWGHEVGFNSYRDQWMSEGFAELSASLFIQLIEKNPKKLIEFWNDERELLLERNTEGFRAIDAGPVTLGYRLSNSRSGPYIPRHLIYPKGAYILHMIQMMLHQRTGDQAFKEMMQDFVRTFGGKAATTEDFKAIVEKHMNQDMIDAADGENNMDWFFNQYVYGTALPSYAFDHSFSTAPDGTIVLSIKLTQSNVDSEFRMPVPLYMEMADGRILWVGRVRMHGNTTVATEIPLTGLKEKPKRAIINYMNDVLAAN